MYDKIPSDMIPLCLRCRGRGFCSRKCPLQVRMNQNKDMLRNVGDNFSGGAPSVFIGRYGYPNVNVGVLSPPCINDDNWKTDAPEYWYSKNYDINDVIDARSSLINSRHVNSVRKPRGRIVDVAHEVAMASKPVSTEFWLKRKPKLAVSLHMNSAPIGSPAMLLKAKPEENVRIEKRVESVVTDDLKSADQMNLLYKKRIDVGQITKILSVGLLGIKKRMVPTRWSITATDDTVSKNMIEQIKDYKRVNDYMVFDNTYVGNHYQILVIPRQWSFEVLELKHAGAGCNPSSTQNFVMADYESYFGRKKYADEVAGGYYAARVGVCEWLRKQKRQASVIVFREVLPEYSIPLGVWQCRENVRGAMAGKSECFNTLEEALSRIGHRFKSDFNNWLVRSALLNEIKTQPSLDRFF